MAAGTGLTLAGWSRLRMKGIGDKKVGGGGGGGGVEGKVK